MLYFQVIAKWFPYIHTSCTLTNNLFVTCHCTDFWIRNWSHIATHLVLVVLVRAPSSKKAQGSFVSNWIWMKFGRNVLRVNIHLLTESDFWLYVAFSRWRPRCHFTQEKCCHLVSAHEAPARLICSSICQFLIHSTFLYLRVYECTVMCVCHLSLNITWLDLTWLCCWQWVYCANTVVYSFTRHGSTDLSVMFWDTVNNEVSACWRH